LSAKKLRACIIAIRAQFSVGPISDKVTGRVSAISPVRTLNAITQKPQRAPPINGASYQLHPPHSRLARDVSVVTALNGWDPTAYCDLRLNKQWRPRSFMGISVVKRIEIVSIVRKSGGYQGNILLYLATPGESGSWTCDRMLPDRDRSHSRNDFGS
jgi:hypothetical protein